MCKSRETSLLSTVAAGLQRTAEKNQPRNQSDSEQTSLDENHYELASILRLTGYEVFCGIQVSGAWIGGCGWLWRVRTRRGRASHEIGEDEAGEKQQAG